MRTAFFKALFVFSLLINVTVVATLVWHLWLQQKPHSTVTDARPASGSEGFHRIKNMWKGNGRTEIMESRKKILNKKIEILDLIAQKPGDLRAVDKEIDELLMLRGNMERAALARISRIMADLPEDRRQEFVVFLKNRACAGPGMGRGRGRGVGPKGMDPCPVEVPEK